MRKLYVYLEEQFDKYKKEQEQRGIEIIPISKFSDAYKNLLNKIEIDLTTLGMALLNRGDLAFHFENLFETIPNEMKFIVSDEYKDIIKKTFKFDFDEMVNLYKFNKQEEKNKSKIIKICDLKNQQIDSILDKLDKKIYGHTRFKEDLKRKLKDYRILNKMKEQKILSIFIMGQSGTGKTELASTLYSIVGGKDRICKISFANYSSKDSLNSLIGSPRGYIGSECGELVKKIKKTDVAIILIDEFEKADEKVHNFFLELLEKGSFSDSQGNDYDLEGYIIFFTSNMTKEDFKKNVLPELRSRFDYVGKFNQLNEGEKKEFLETYIEELISKYKKTIKGRFDEKIKEKIKSKIDVNNYNNIRVLKKEIASKFIELVNN